jgi:transcriptional regulator with XRE-family HTH domain
MSQKLALRLRNKILGVQLHSARRFNGRTLEECARLIGLSANAYESIEAGRRAISLPQLEQLSLFFRLPISQLLSSEPIKLESSLNSAQTNLRLELRNRMIGILLKKQRVEQNLPLSTVAEKLDILENILASYESGIMGIPIAHLEKLAQIYKIDFESLAQKDLDAVGQKLQNQEAANRVSELPLDLQAFVSNPQNAPYLRISQSLSELPVQRLREIAEGLLEITY